MSKEYICIYENLDTYVNSCIQIMHGSAFIVRSVLIFLIILFILHNHVHAPLNEHCKQKKENSISKLYDISFILGIILAIENIIFMFVLIIHISNIYNPSVIETIANHVNFANPELQCGTFDISVWTCYARIDSDVVKLTSYSNIGTVVIFIISALTLISYITFFICTCKCCELILIRRIT